MDKYPLGVGIEVKLGNPFVASTDKHLRNRVIVQSVTLTSQHGEAIYTCYEMVDPNPTEEEIFKITLKNPQPLVAVTVNTESVYRRRPEDN